MVKSGKFHRCSHLSPTIYDRVIVPTMTNLNPIHTKQLVHEEGMWLPQWLDKKTVTYAKISPKMVNPRDTAGERRRRRRIPSNYMGINLSDPSNF